MPTIAASTSAPEPAGASVPSPGRPSTVIPPAGTAGPGGTEPQAAVDPRAVIYELAKLIGRQIARDLMANTENTTQGEEIR